MVPREYGQRLPFYFPLLPGYWRGGGPKPQAPAALPELAQNGAVHAGGPDGKGGGVAVAVRGLCKVFATTDGCSKRAVDDLTLDVRTNQVTALLGEILQSCLCSSAPTRSPRCSVRPPGAAFAGAPSCTCACI